MDLLDVLRSHGVEYRLHGEHHHVGQGWIGIDCVHCSPNSGKFRMGIHLSRFSCTCWTCGTHSLYQTLRELIGEGFRDVFPLLEKQQSFRREKKPRGKLVLPKGLGELQKPHRNYLHKRALDPDELGSLWRLQGIGMDGSPPWRIFVPITLSGEVVSWTTRSLHNKGVRYLNARPEEESISAKDVLFGEEFCGHTVVVVEGSFDAMAIGPGAVAVMGLKVSARQFERICSFPLRVIAFDSEREAQRRAGKLCQELKLFPGETYLVELSGKDAASSPKHEIEELRRRFLK